MKRHIGTCAILTLALFPALAGHAFATTAGGLDTPAGVTDLPLQVEGVTAIDIQSAAAMGGEKITFDFPTTIKFPFTAGNTIINTDGSITASGALSITTTAGLLTSNSAGGTYGIDIIAPHRIQVGDQVNGGTGGMWVGPGQFVGSESSTELGFYNNGAWRLNVHNDGWVTFNGEYAQLGSWKGAAGDPYDYATFGAAGNQQLVIRTDLSAFFFPWTAPGTLYVNGNIIGDNPSHNASLCINGVCETHAKPTLKSSETIAVGVSATLTAGTVVACPAAVTRCVSATTASNHDLCQFSGTEVSGTNNNCLISGTPGGTWTVTAQELFGETNCAIQCYDFQ